MAASEYMPAGHVVAVYAQNPAQGMLYVPGWQLKHAAAVVLARVGLYEPASQQPEQPLPMSTNCIGPEPEYE